MSYDCYALAIPWSRITCGAGKEGTIDAKTGESIAWIERPRSNSFWIATASQCQRSCGFLKQPMGIHGGARKGLIMAVKGRWAKLKSGTVDK